MLCSGKKRDGALLLRVSYRLKFIVMIIIMITQKDKLNKKCRAYLVGPTHGQLVVVVRLVGVEVRTHFVHVHLDLIARKASIII